MDSMTLEVFSNLCDSMTLPLPGMSLDVLTHLPALHTYCVSVGSAPQGLCGHAQHVLHLTPSPPPFPAAPSGSQSSSSASVCLSPAAEPGLPLPALTSCRLCTASASIRPRVFPAQEISSSAGAPVLLLLQPGLQFCLLTDPPQHGQKQ